MSKASPFTPEESARARAIHQELLAGRFPQVGAHDLKEPPRPFLGRAVLLLIIAAVHIGGGYLAYQAWWSKSAGPMITTLPSPPSRNPSDVRPVQRAAQPGSNATRAPSSIQQTRPPVANGRSATTSAPSPANRLRSAPPTASASARVPQQVEARRAQPVSAHAAKARAHAEHYFRYQHRFGSGSIHVSSLSVQLQGTDEMPGWNRYVTKGTVGVQFYDSAGRSSRRSTLGFEATTHEVNGTIEIVDFDVKSSSYLAD